MARSSEHTRSSAAGRTGRARSTEPRGDSLAGRALCARYDVTTQLDIADRLLAETIGFSEEIPVFLPPLLDRLGIDVVHSSQHRLSGRQCKGLLAYTSIKQGRFVVHIPRQLRDNYPRRYRFTIAHEIGHILLMKKFGSQIFEWVTESERGYKFVETLCDRVAAEILLPRQVLKAHLRTTAFSGKSISDLVAKFIVSRQVLLHAICAIPPQGGGFVLRKFQPKTATVPASWRVFQPCVRYPHPAYVAKNATDKHFALGIPLADLDFDVPTYLSARHVAIGNARSRFDGLATKWRLPPGSGAMFPTVNGDVFDFSAGEIFVLLWEEGSSFPDDALAGLGLRGEGVTQE